MKRFYCEDIKQGYVDLNKSESHHLLHVMRGGKGAQIELFDGKGTLSEAVVVEISKKKVTVEVTKTRFFEPRTGKRVIIASAIAKGQRFDWMVSKCTELGVDCIVPLIFERSVKQASGDSVLERYKKLAIAAAKQCGRVHLPEIFLPIKLSNLDKLLQKYYPNAMIMLGGLDEKTSLLARAANCKGDLVAVIGPEGGMTPAEEENLIKIGAVRATITDTVLRTETASLAFASILCALRGSFGAKTSGNRG